MSGTISESMIATGFFFRRRRITGFLANAALLSLFAMPAGKGQVPSINSQPRDSVAGAGISRVFTVGTSLLPRDKAYQWFHDGVPLTSATNQSLLIPDARFEDEGTYHVAVSNEFGAVLSAPASLQVVPAAQVRHLASISPPPVPRVQFPGAPMWVKVVDGHAFIATKQLHIYDVTDPAAPVPISVYGTSSSEIYSVSIQDDRAYVTDGGNIEIIDVSNRAMPSRLGRLQLPRMGLDVVVRGDYAYVGASGGFLIVNVSNPTNIVVESEFRSASVYTVDLAGDVAYLGATSDGIHVLDVSDPQSPVFLTTLTEFNQFVDTVKVAGNRLYSTGHSIAAYDISNPRAPRSLGAPLRRNSFASQGMTARGDFVLTGDERPIGLDPGKSFSIFDASKGENIIEIARIKPARSTYTVECVDFVGRYIYAAIGTNVEVFEWTAPTNPPAMVQPPQNALLVEGAPARLEAHASGGEPLTYQWSRDGVILGSETNRTLRLPPVSALDAGEYSVSASNSVGVIAATNAVSIIPPPLLEMTVNTRTSGIPFLVIPLPEGLQTRLEATTNFQPWEAIWSGHAPASALEVRDASGRNLPTRFYRFNFGLE